MMNLSPALLQMLASSGGAGNAKSKLVEMITQREDIDPTTKLLLEQALTRDDSDNEALGDTIDMERLREQC
jgi:hypothetical protein